MTEEIQLSELARPEDFHNHGSLHGRNCAIAIIEHLISGQRDYASLYRYHVETVMAEKEIELRSLGASDTEIGIFLKASMDTTLNFLAEFESRASSHDDFVPAFYQPGVDEIRSLSAEAFRRLNNREFTLGCLEFEGLFQKTDISVTAVLINSELIKALGAYLACCCMTDRQPTILELLIHPKIKSEAMENALHFVKEWESDPALRLINFVRRLS